MNDIVDSIGRVRRIALIVATLAIVACAIGLIVSPAQFYRSWLFAHVFWVGISLGAMALLMIGHLTGGRWAYVTRRLLESATICIPLMALLFVPLLFGMGEIWDWVGRDEVTEARNEILYLSAPFFVVRAALCWAVWITLAALLVTWSRKSDRLPGSALPRRMRLLSGPGLALHVLTVSVSSTDWTMSLQPHWYSTIYALIVMAGQVLGALALTIVALEVMARREPLHSETTPAEAHDLGNLMLATVMFWAYVSFSQFLITWYGDMPSEVKWYTGRISGGWQALAFVVIVLHFAVPFFLLLFRRHKKALQRLAAIAACVFAVRIVTDFWHVAPPFHPDALGVQWLDFVAPVAIGALWIALAAGQLAAHPLLPRPELDAREVPAHG